MDHEEFHAFLGDVCAEALAKMLAPKTPTIVGMGLGSATGFAVRLPDGRVVTWLDGEPVPPGVAFELPPL